MCQLFHSNHLGANFKYRNDTPVFLQSSMLPQLSSHLYCSASMCLHVMEALSWAVKSSPVGELTQSHWQPLCFIFIFGSHLIIMWTTFTSDTHTHSYTRTHTHSLTSMTGSLSPWPIMMVSWRWALALGILWQILKPSTQNSIKMV